MVPDLTSTAAPSETSRRHRLASRSRSSVGCPSSAPPCAAFRRSPRARTPASATWSRRSRPTRASPPTCCATPTRRPARAPCAPHHPRRGHARRTQVDRPARDRGRHVPLLPGARPETGPLDRPPAPARRRCRGRPGDRRAHRRHLDVAHLGGLLHDVGKLVMPLAFGADALDAIAAEHQAGTRAPCSSGSASASTTLPPARWSPAPPSSSRRSRPRSPSTTAAPTALGSRLARPPA